MQIFNIGPVELILIILIMFILLGPEGMIKTARQIGTWIRSLIKSPMWRDIMGYSREIRDLPTKIVRETGLDEDLKEIQKTTQDLNSDIKGTISEANKEVEQSLKEAGSVDVRLDTNPPAASRSTIQPPAKQTTSTPVQPADAPDDEKIAESPVSAAPVQTFHKYTTDEDEEEDE